jgi:hypothetical protein
MHRPNAVGTDDIDHSNRSDESLARTSQTSITKALHEFHSSMKVLAYIPTYTLHALWIHIL